jgi:hypothetical protein
VWQSKLHWVKSIARQAVTPNDLGMSTSKFKICMQSNKRLGNSFQTLKSTKCKLLTSLKILKCNGNWNEAQASYSKHDWTVGNRKGNGGRQSSDAYE